MKRLALMLAVAIGIAGCAAHRPPDGVAAFKPHGVAHESLGSYIARVRALAANARPTPKLGTMTLESWDPALSAALLQLAAGPTPERHRRVAMEYRRLGVLDRAHASLTRAIALDPHDAAAFDLRARIWRDWGFASIGLGDAYRAVYFAPASASAANTLGTLLQATGDANAARGWYAHALTLDAGAEFALNNLCYADIVLRRADAVGACERAASIATASRSARNNLALAYAAAGDFERARAQFDGAGDAASALYNMGIVYMGQRQYRRAAEAFGAALRAKPQLTLAAVRLGQARAADEEESSGDRH